MSNKGRWTEPTDRTARDEYRELRRELKLSRTAKARRTEIETRLDELAADPKEPSFREPKPTTDSATRAKGTPWQESILSGLPPARDGRERAIERARNATPVEKAAAMLADLPEHPLNKLARELERYIWNEDKSRPNSPWRKRVLSNGGAYNEDSGDSAGTWVLARGKYCWCEPSASTIDQAGKTVAEKAMQADF